MSGFSVAALLVVVGLCADGSPGELCKYDDAQWVNPTAAELQECADRAEAIRDADGQAICELVPVADGAGDDFAEPAKATITIGPLEINGKVMF